LKFGKKSTTVKSVHPTSITKDTLLVYREYIPATLPAGACRIIPVVRCAAYQVIVENLIKYATVNPLSGSGFRGFGFTANLKRLF
jgi:hypothetical protein